MSRRGRSEPAPAASARPYGDRPAELEERFAASMRRLLGGVRPRALGVAVSGGGDSTALMHLAADWARGEPPIHVVTVDHGLRAGAAAEAETVGRQASALGLPHAVLRWRWDGTGNLQATARDGRRVAIGDWAREANLRAVLLGHTLDDQAETLVMRLSRGSGVEGLSAMDAGALDPSRPFLRPLLDTSRDELRAWLRARGIAWIEDPSNEDPRFERVRARRAIAALGLDPARLADTAARMARAREALEIRAFEIGGALMRPAPPGEVRLERDGLAATDEETRLRILSGALRCMSGAPYRPREDDLRRMAAAALDRRARTLHGCVVRPDGGTLLIHRELSAVAGLTAPAGPAEPWDGAWTLCGQALKGCEIRVLGEEGLRRIGAEARDRGTPAPFGCRTRAALAAKPAPWRGDALIGFASLGFGAPYAETWRPRGGTFPACLLTRPRPAT